MGAPERHSAVNHAIVIAAQVEASPIPSVECYSLLPFIDRPAVQHALESAVRCGVKTVDVIAADGLNRMRDLLGDGARWGVTLRIHGVANGAEWQPAVQAILRDSDGDGSDQVLVLNGTQLLPNLHQQLQDAESENVAWKITDSQQIAGLVANRDVLTRLTSSVQRSTLTETITENASQHAVRITTADGLRLHPAKELLACQRRVLEGEFPILTAHLKNVEPGIWIGRNIRLHPTAKLRAPLLIGNNSDIDEGTEIGPNAVIGSDTVILRNTVAADCLVMPYSSIGEDLCLNDCLVEPSCIHNTRIGVTLGIIDEVLVADLRRNMIPAGISNGLSRFGGLLLWLLLCVPATAYRLWLTSKRRACSLRVEAMHLPHHAAHQSSARVVNVNRYTTSGQKMQISTGIRTQWADLWLRVTPGLRSVMSGRVSLFGTNLRTAEQLYLVPSHWSDMLGNYPPGLITESLVQYGPDADVDQRCICDVWTTVAAGSRFRGAFALRYLASLLRGPESRQITAESNGVSDQSASDQPSSDTQLRHTESASGLGHRDHMPSANLIPTKGTEQCHI